ncbi:TetR/AcrR family transcriptional regulator [Nocardioides sp. B-3]|uniref:TetR/AcrR family transcriptional regulator n=1 Tax=Nocardioides sp. B-3 TaxID=2895565 RepID=UPI0021533E1E|nr:TetR/AcrR family transcriptional regulator [Nocardioides sp. B-3]UUZ58390.1 TetR/AcrR family transcriptional regulator [Nocardioides sp. B-3]
MSHDLSVCGLRAVKKERTRRALSRAAVAIVADEGIDALTADRIAAEAGVSRADPVQLLPPRRGRADRLDRAGHPRHRRGLPWRVRRTSPCASRSRPCWPGCSTTRSSCRPSSSSGRRSRRRRRAGSCASSPTPRSTPSRRACANASAPDADPVYVAALAASVGAILTRMTRLVVAQMPDADPTDASLSRRYHDSIRRSFDLLFAGFDETGARSNPTREN